jgi:hypothetical protein
MAAAEQLAEYKAKLREVQQRLEEVKMDNFLLVETNNVLEEKLAQVQLSISSPQVQHPISPQVPNPISPQVQHSISPQVQHPISPQVQHPISPRSTQSDKRRSDEVVKVKEASFTFQNIPPEATKRDVRKFIYKQKIGVSFDIVELADQKAVVTFDEYPHIVMEKLRILKWADFIIKAEIIKDKDESEIVPDWSIRQDAVWSEDVEDEEVM